MVNVPFEDKSPFSIVPRPDPDPLNTSPSANNETRSWTTLDEFVAEVSSARIFGGMHYRSSTEVGNAMGEQIGELAAQKFSLGTKP